MSEEERTLGQQCRDEIKVLEDAIAEIVTDFEVRTGLKVQSLELLQHNYDEPYYSVMAKIDL